MAKLEMIINLDECTGCDLCQIACKDEHVGNSYLPWTKPQPDTAHFWIKVNPIERGQIPKVKVTYVPMLCVHCDNAPCMKACPESAITKRDDGTVWINPNKCSGSRLCQDACPYDVIYFNEKSNIAQKCTWCMHLTEKGDIPRCVDVCPRDAIIFGDEDSPKLKELKSKAELLNPEYETKPRIYYLGLPKPFIAGTVIDDTIHEVNVGAKVTAIDLFNDEQHAVFTDEFGDFQIKDLRRDHKYVVSVEKSSYEKRTLVVTTDKDRNLGEINLKKVSQSATR
jgi:Fe-S-cluster-containing dehydrogenase component